MNYFSHAYLNILAAAVTEGIHSGHFDPVAPNRDPLDPRTSVLFDARLGSIPLRVCVGDWRFDEARVSVAAWPTPDVDQWVGAFGAKQLAGEVTATGYLNRASTGRLRLSDPFEPTIFMRRDRSAIMKGIPAPDDVADPFRLYPRMMSYAAAA